MYNCHIIILKWHNEFLIIFLQTLKILHRTLKERQQLLILYRVKPNIKLIFDNYNLKISCCETENDIEETLAGKSKN